MTARLPPAFAALEPFVAAWAHPSAALRDAARSDQPADHRAAFFATMAPLLAPALTHLDRTPLVSHSPDDYRLSSA